jgi:hypothetical protein
MKFKVISAILAVAFLYASTCFAKDDNKNKKAKTRKMPDHTLQDLYKREAACKAAIQKSAGYAVFNNMGTNLLLLSTALGAGIAVNSKIKQETL